MTDDDMRPPEPPPPKPHRRPPRSSTARRRPLDGGAVGRRVMLAALAACFVIVAVHELRHESPELTPRPPVATPGSTRPIAPAPAPAVSPEPSPTVEMASDWVVLEIPTATVTPLATPPPTPTRRDRRPTATPSVRSCVRYSWSAGQSMAAWGNVLVEIRVENACRRSLQPMQLWFRVSGWRDGAEVHHAHGHAFDEIRPGGREEVIIGLPGSVDWYHELRVEVLDSPP